MSVSEWALQPCLGSPSPDPPSPLPKPGRAPPLEAGSEQLSLCPTSCVHPRAHGAIARAPRPAHHVGLPFLQAPSRGSHGDRAVMGGGVCVLPQGRGWLPFNPLPSSTFFLPLSLWKLQTQTSNLVCFMAPVERQRAGFCSEGQSSALRLPGGGLGSVSLGLTFGFLI